MIHDAFGSLLTSLQRRDPILGDLRYGAGTPLPGKQIALLAHHLSVMHPTQGTRLNLICPLPQSWPWSADDAALGARPPWEWRMLKGPHE